MTASTTTKIALGSLVRDLVEEGIIDQADARRAQGGSTQQHPILALSRMDLVDRRQPSRRLSSGLLTQWLAERLAIPFVSINPLSIDVEKTTAVMSFGFAKSHQILCVESTAKAIVIATARPDRTDWVSSIEQMTRRKVRLVRRLCTACRRQVPAEAGAWCSLVGDALPMQAQLYAAGGCLECRNTGYRGRQGIYELLIPDRQRNQIQDQSDLDAARSEAVRSGWHHLRYAGALKVARGDTTIEEVFRVTPHLLDAQEAG